LARVVRAALSKAILARQLFLRQLPLPIGLQELEMGGLQGILSQATVYLPTAPVGLEPTTLRLTSDRSAIEL
jgi:hypothetical protein